MNRIRPVRRALTLFELLVSIGLVAALVASMSWFLWDLLAARRQVLETAARRDAITTLMERLERDLFTCIAGDAVYGSGVRGDGRTLRVLSRDVPARDASTDPARGLTDLSVATYHFDAERGQVLIDRASGLDRAAWTPRPGALPGTVAMVRFRYHDGTAWRDDFDSRTAGRLPEAVEVAVWFAPRPGVPGLGDETEDDPFALPDDEADDTDGRLTFDPGAGFDESAFAAESDFEGLPPPRPDRLRVIPVPDAAPDDGGDA